MAACVVNNILVTHTHNNSINNIDDSAVFVGLQLTL
mgnify:CR=1 FL=1